MDVYFKPTYLKEENSKKGILQNANIVFEYDGNECRIPALYLFEEGIVVDVFEKVDNGKAESFINKVYDKSLTEVKLKLLSMYNPFENLYIKELSADGEKSIGSQIQKFYVYSDTLQEKLHKSDRMSEIQRQMVKDWKDEFDFLSDNHSYSIQRYVFNINNYGYPLDEPRHNMIQLPYERLSNEFDRV